MSSKGRETKRMRSRSEHSLVRLSPKSVVIQLEADVFLHCKHVVLNHSPMHPIHLTAPDSDGYCQDFIHTVIDTDTHIDPTLHNLAPKYKDRI